MTAEEARARELLTAAGVRGPIAARLSRYAALVMAGNRRLNLTGAKSIEEFIPHVLDSLTLVPYAASPLVDVGSGAGLPGLPLAIATKAEVTLAEANSKRVSFLKSAVAELGLNVQVEAGRAEELGHRGGLREHFLSATGRALSTAPAVLELLAPFLQIGGVALLQRGKLMDDEKSALDEAASLLSCRLLAEVPLGGERRLLLVEKIGPTAARFPRRTGVAQKRPLGS